MHGFFLALGLPSTSMRAVEAWIGDHLVVTAIASAAIILAALAATRSCVLALCGACGGAKGGATRAGGASDQVAYSSRVGCNGTAGTCDGGYKRAVDSNLMVPRLKHWQQEEEVELERRRHRLALKSQAGGGRASPLVRESPSLSCDETDEGIDEDLYAIRSEKMEEVARSPPRSKGDSSLSLERLDGDLGSSSSLSLVDKELQVSQ